MTLPRCWILLGRRKGDNNQLLALGEALGWPFETRTLDYNVLRALGPRRLGTSLVSLDPRSRRWVAPPWPDLVIGIGHRSVPVARWIRHRSDRRTLLVRIGNPRIDPDVFDLVVTTPQYPVRDAPNVLVQPLAMSRYRRLLPAEPDAQASRLDEPFALMAIGGSNRDWRLDPDTIVDAAKRLAERAAQGGKSLVVSGSPRTDPSLIVALKESLGRRDRFRIVGPGGPRFAELLAQCDEIFVTADSALMLSEAVQSGKPVGLIEVEPAPQVRQKAATARRDLQAFWAGLQSAGLVGTIDAPVRGTFDDPVERAAARVRDLLAERFG